MFGGRHFDGIWEVMDGNSWLFDAEVSLGGRWEICRLVGRKFTNLVRYICMKSTNLGRHTCMNGALLVTSYEELLIVKNVIKYLSTIEID